MKVKQKLSHSQYYLKVLSEQLFCYAFFQFVCMCLHIFCIFYMSVGTHSCLYICGHPILISRGIPILGGGLPIEPRGCKYSSLPSQVVLVILSFRSLRQELQVCYGTYTAIQVLQGSELLLSQLWKSALSTRTLPSPYIVLFKFLDSRCSVTLFDLVFIFCSLQVISKPRRDGHKCL